MQTYCRPVCLDTLVPKNKNNCYRINATAVELAVRNRDKETVLWAYIWSEFEEH